MSAQKVKQNAVMQQWPELMQAQTAASYVDESSVRAFRRRVGKVYPRGRRIPGRGTVWVKREMDEAIAKVAASAAPIRDAADVL
jgi:hypothetical protein